MPLAGRRPGGLPVSLRDVLVSLRFRPVPGPAAGRRAREAGVDVRRDRRRPGAATSRTGRSSRISARRALSPQPDLREGPTQRPDFYAAPRRLRLDRRGRADQPVLRKEHASSRSRVRSPLLPRRSRCSWAVHVWSEIVGERIELGMHFTLRSTRGQTASREEWPLIFPEAAILSRRRSSALSRPWWGGVLERRHGIDDRVIVVFCVIQLFAWVASSWWAPRLRSALWSGRCDPLFGRPGTPLTGDRARLPLLGQPFVH